MTWAIIAAKLSYIFQVMMSENEQPGEPIQDCEVQNKKSFTVILTYNSINRAQSLNLPNHKGMSAGITAQLGPHPGRKHQVLSKCPQKRSGRKSILLV